MITEFDPVNHIGKVDGVIWPSVTQLLSEAKMVDYSGVPRDILANKSLLGRRVHLATLFVDNGSFNEDEAKENFPEILPYLEAYRKFREIESFEPIHKEERYFSKKWRFHGAPDETGVHFGMFGGRQSLIDYKCTWRMYESTGPQLSGYEILLEECRGLKIKNRYGLLLKPTGNYELTQFNDATDRQDFLAALWLHWRRREKYKTQKGVFNDGAEYA